MRRGDVARSRPRHPEDLIRVAPLVTFSPLLPPLVPSRPLSSLLVTRVQTQGAEQRKKVGGSICLKQQPAGGWAVVLDNFDIGVKRYSNIQTRHLQLLLLHKTRSFFLFEAFTCRNLLGIRTLC